MYIKKTTRKRIIIRDKIFNSKNFYFVRIKLPRITDEKFEKNKGLNATKKYI